MFAIVIISIILIVLLILYKKYIAYFDNDLKFYDENDNLINNKFLESIEQILSKKYIKSTDRVLELGARYGTVSCVINKILRRL